MRFLSLALVLVACHKKTPEPSASAGLHDLNPLSAAELAARDEARQEDVVRLTENFKRVYFATDSATLDTDSRAALTENAAILTHWPELRVEVQGHADERGTTEYNLALGQRRATAVTSWLGTQGVPADRLAAVSYGEEMPATAGSSESAWTANRRAEFRVTWGANTTVAGTTN